MEKKPPAPEACPYCEQLAPSRKMQSLHWIWECACGAIGVGDQPCDLDEAADALMDFLDFPPAPPWTGVTPPEPVGSSGLIYAQYYDNGTLAGRLRPFFISRGYELLLVKTTMGARPDFEANLQEQMAQVTNDALKAQYREMLERVREWAYWLLWAKRLGVPS